MVWIECWYDSKKVVQKLSFLKWLKQRRRNDYHQRERLHYRNLHPLLLKILMLNNHGCYYHIEMTIVLKDSLLINEWCSSSCSFSLVIVVLFVSLIVVEKKRYSWSYHCLITDNRSICYTLFDNRKFILFMQRSLYSRWKDNTIECPIAILAIRILQRCYSFYVPIPL